MRTPLASWTHPTNGFELYKLEHIGSYESGPKTLKLLKLEFRKTLIQTLQTNTLCFPIWCYRGELFHCSMLCKVDDRYMGRLAMITKLNANTDCVMSMKWSQVR